MTVTVCIPVYNREKTIGRCLNSILNQTVGVSEIICVDDGSTDNSINVINLYKKNDSRIKLLKQNHKGAQEARNKAIKDASSEWIAFLDSDDEWCENFLEIMLKKIERMKNSREYVYVSKCFRDNGKERVIWNLPGKSGNIYRNLLIHPWPMFQGMIATKKAFESIDYLDVNCPSYQEWDTSIRLAKNYRFCFVDEPLFIYYVDQDIPTISSSGKDFCGWEYVVGKHKNDIWTLLGYKYILYHYRILAKKATHFARVKYLIKFFLLTYNVRLYS